MSLESAPGDRLRLRDIIAAAVAISEHLEMLGSEGIPERIAVDAIKYNLVAIGEAAHHLSADVRLAPREVDWLAITGLRNILTHEYFKVNTDLIREIAESAVPDLLKKAESLLTDI